jgi:hypothetical protein
VTAATPIANTMSSALRRYLLSISLKSHLQINVCLKDLRVILVVTYEECRLLDIPEDILKVALCSEEYMPKTCFKISWGR